LTYDAIDRKILVELRNNSRESAAMYAKRTGIPKSTVHDRLQKLSKSVRCVPILHLPAVGYCITVCFFAPYSESLAQFPCVNTAQRVAPNLLYLECVFSSMKELESFKQEHRLAKSFMVIDVLKKEGFRINV
jgi:DNA-binding Lrp family transcriptional regulator